MLSLEEPTERKRCHRISGDHKGEIEYASKTRGGLMKKKKTATSNDPTRNAPLNSPSIFGQKGWLNVNLFVPAPIWRKSFLEIVGTDRYFRRLYGILRDSMPTLLAGSKRFLMYTHTGLYFSCS